jgi:hypothetical protein
MNITAQEYQEEINSLAQDLVSELSEEIKAENDYDEVLEGVRETIQDRIHETVDSHQWVIYYSYNSDVIQHSDNEDAYLDVYDNESLGQIVAEKGVEQLGTIRAYFAMYQDLAEACQEEIEKLEVA